MDSFRVHYITVSGQQMQKHLNQKKSWYKYILTTSFIEELESRCHSVYCMCLRECFWVLIDFIQTHPYFIMSDTWKCLLWYLTRAVPGGGGRLDATHSDFFADSRKIAACSAAGFSPTLSPRFSASYVKPFNPRSRKVRSPGRVT